MTDSPDDGILHGPLPAALTEMLLDIEDEATIRRYDAQADEWWIRCRLCGGEALADADEEVAGHTALCPLPAISRWLDHHGKLA